MAKLLYITAHPHDDRTSYSMAVGKAFMEAYQESHPGDEVEHLDLYRMTVPQIDTDVFSGWGKLSSGSTDLSPDEKKKVERIDELTSQFMAADKFVFVTPMWNLFFPPVLKAYIDAICIAGKTFKYTEQGPVGLMEGKKALHIQAAGGFYSQGPAADMNYGHKYLEGIMGFLGIRPMEAIFVEGMAYQPDRAPAIKAQAIEAAKEKAPRF